LIGLIVILTGRLKAYKAPKKNWEWGAKIIPQDDSGNSFNLIGSRDNYYLDSEENVAVRKGFYTQTRRKLTRKLSFCLK